MNFTQVQQSLSGQMKSLRMRRQQVIEIVLQFCCGRSALRFLSVASQMGGAVTGNVNELRFRDSRLSAVEFAELQKPTKSESMRYIERERVTETRSQ